MSKTLLFKADYLDRRKSGLPIDKCRIEIIVTSKVAGDEVFNCMWIPYDEKLNRPQPGYLGTAKITRGKFQGIGFHAWEQNESEFVYYKILE